MRRMGEIEGLGLGGELGGEGRSAAGKNNDGIRKVGMRDMGGYGMSEGE